MTTTTTTAPNFADLLATATTDPGRLSSAYSAFHNYSLGNQLLAFGQCLDRQLPLGPIATYGKWQELGRQVQRGSKALVLCMPITSKRRPAEGDDTDEGGTFTRFVYKPNWFVMSQTEGEPYMPEVPTWDRARALAALDVREVEFAHLDGNCQGYAFDRSIAINPVAAAPVKTLLHEIAHVLLGHTAEGQLSDDDRTPRDLREVEAEGTAMLVCAALGLPGLDESRGYIQHWYGAGSVIPEASARRIFKAADSILKAGRPVDEKGGQ